MRVLIFILFSLLSSIQLNAADTETDSLFVASIFDHIYALEEAQYDQVADLLDSVAFILKRSKNVNQQLRLESTRGWLHEQYDRYDSAVHYYRNTIDLQLNYQIRESLDFNYMYLMGACFRNGGQSEAEAVFHEAMAQSDSNWDVYVLTFLLETMGTIHLNRSEYVGAIEMYSRTIRLTMADSLHNQQLLALNNLGLVYAEMGDTAKVLDQFNKVLETATRVGDKWWMATAYLNMAIIYTERAELTLADSLVDLGEELYYSIQDLVGEMFVAGCRGQIAIEREDYNSAIEYFHLYQELSESTGLPNSGQADLSLAIAYQKAGNCSKAIGHAESALSIIASNDMSILSDDVYDVLADCFGRRGQHPQALAALEESRRLHDSTVNDKNRKAAIRQQISYDFEMKAYADSMAELETERQLQAAQQAEKEAKQYRNRIQYSGIILLVLLLGALIALSGKFNIGPNVAEGLIFIFFILLFEFMLVVMDPYVDEWSNGEVAYKLAINSVFALVVFFGHQYFEGKLKKALIGSTASSEGKSS